MFEYPSSSSALQFLTAEYLGIVPCDHCRMCGQLIAEEYFRVGSQMACRNCAMKSGFEEPNRRQANFGRALLYGFGAALAGMAACAAVAALTGWMIAVLAVATGYAIGQCIKKGANNVEDGRYGWTAALLTYLAIVIGTIPAGAAREILQSNPGLGWGERIVAGGTLTLISPFLQFERKDNGAFVLLIIGASMLLAAKQISSKPQLILGPFPKDPPKPASGSGHDEH